MKVKGIMFQSSRVEFVILQISEEHLLTQQQGITSTVSALSGGGKVMQRTLWLVCCY